MKFYILIRKRTGYPGVPLFANKTLNQVVPVHNTGRPGHPPGSQWQSSKIIPCRLKDGRHMLYMDAITLGNSGSPLYMLREEQSQKKAFVVAVHVGNSSGGMGSCAVPLCTHMEIDTEFSPGKKYC